MIINWFPQTRYLPIKLFFLYLLYNIGTIRYSQRKYIIFPVSARLSGCQDLPKGMEFVAVFTEDRTKGWFGKSSESSGHRLCSEICCCVNWFLTQIRWLMAKSRRFCGMILGGGFGGCSSRTHDSPIFWDSHLIPRCYSACTDSPVSSLFALVKRRLLGTSLLVCTSKRWFHWLLLLRPCTCETLLTTQLFPLSKVKTCFVWWLYDYLLLLFCTVPQRIL